jgi:hypothetical protein
MKKMKKVHFVIIIRMNKNLIYSIILLLSIFLSENTFCQDECLLKHKADSLYLAQDYYGAINGYKQKQSRLYDNYYMIAVCFCALNMPDSTEFYFDRAIKHNFYYKKGSSLNSDTYLSCIQGNKMLDTLVKSNYENRYKNIDEDLKNEFLHRKIIDQKVRHHEDLDSLCGVYRITNEKLFFFIDSLNMVFLDSVIKKIERWPGIDFIGNEGDDAAWVIAQHADNFIDFQEKCYRLLEDAYDNNNTASTNIPYLYDRIMINKGLKQRYATQMRVIDNKVIFINLEDNDEHYIDHLRHCYNLQPLKLYKQDLEKRFLQNEEK